MSRHLFVYGTLKQGLVRHSVLRDQLFCCSVWTSTRCRLLSCGSYPALVECSNGMSVRGELYQVTDQCLQRCDEVEGVATGLYERRLIGLEPDQQTANPVSKAWCYFYLLSTDGLPQCGAEWLD